MERQIVSVTCGWPYMGHYQPGHLAYQFHEYELVQRSHANQFNYYIQCYQHLHHLSGEQNAIPLKGHKTGFLASLPHTYNKSKRSKNMRFPI